MSDGAIVCHVEALDYTPERGRIMTGHLLSQATAQTVSYPTNHLIAIHDSLEDAQQAVEALRQTGFAEGDTCLLSSVSDVVEVLGPHEQHWNLFDRIRQAVTSVVSDEDPYREMYVQAMRQGHHMVAVHVMREQQLQLATGVLKLHRGHTIKFFGWWAITSHL